MHQDIAGDRMCRNEMYSRFLDKRVAITKGDSNCFVGMCRSIDGYLNVVLEDAEYAEKTKDPVNLKTCFVTGNSLKHISIIND